MNRTTKLAAALALALPALLGSPVSAAVTARREATVSPSSEDNPIYVLVGQAAVDLQRLSGNEDGNEPQ